MACVTCICPKENCSNHGKCCQCIKKHKDMDSFLIKLNGKEAGFLFSGHYIVNVKDLLKTGLNTLEIEVTTSLRNTLGPHHLECGESYSVGTLSFNKEPNVLDWPNNPYNENYCNVEYGLDDIEFL